jgi:hypothetical protein
MRETRTCLQIKNRSLSQPLFLLSFSFTFLVLHPIARCQSQSQSLLSGPGTHSFKLPEHDWMQSRVIMMGMYSEMCIIQWFYHCANIVEYAQDNWSLGQIISGPPCYMWLVVDRLMIVFILWQSCPPLSLPSLQHSPSLCIPEFVGSSCHVVID